MKRELTAKAGIEVADDVCSLSLVRRMAALLDHAPETYRTGDPLPRGWHVMLFNPPTAQKLLRHDGVASLGFTMPDLGLPRLMMGGRKIEFLADIPIGEAVVRRSRLGQIAQKEGRSGPFALIEVEHEISLSDSGKTALVEISSYILRPAEDASQRLSSPLPKPREHTSIDLPKGAFSQAFKPDEMMLFRYSAITDNPHRIHFDFPYATEVEGYPGLVVNGTLPQMILLDMFRKHSGREPSGYESRNTAPVFCGSPMTLSVFKQGEGYTLAAHKDDGQIAIEAEAW